MAYIPTEWANGDVITAEKLNKIEEGIVNAGGTMIVTVTNEDDTSTLSNTYKEIKDAIDAGHVAYISYNGDYIVINEIGGGDGYYAVATTSHTWETDNENGYPSYYYGD